MNAIRKPETWRVPALIAVGLAVSTCDDGVQGMKAEQQALATLHVTLTGPLPPPPPDRPLRPRVSLVWADAGTFEDPFCADFTYGLPPPPTLTDLVERGCRDVLGFLPRSVGDSVALDAAGKADLPVYFLPAANDMQGPPEGRLAYASVVVFDDRNGNGAFDLGRTRPQFGQPEMMQGGGHGGGGPGGNGPPEGGAGPGSQLAAQPGVKSPNETDAVIAASWVTLRQPHVRAALREGDDVAKLRLFYPTPGCQPPPKFLSRFEVQDPLEIDFAKLLGGMRDEKPKTLDPLALFKPVRCAAQALDGAAVTLAAQPTEVVGAVRCRADRPFYFEAERRQDQDGNETESPFAVTPAPTPHCLDANHLALVNDGPCKGITHYFLRGCYDEYECPKNKKTGKSQKPDYDFSAPAKQPKWWPCGTPEPWAP